ncbi:uncharacterized protein LOC110455601 [Mizuhopecten yessoensis]|uniref:Protein shisa-5 n=1 Tax=Mizuhopecten yessoensis TaxID=6573 RepID=A0A210QCU1_MIZYE|nr:uncharacterized protein LOC110455601 [Mizuhopecten yessoensis]OWF46539.1 hypothetical protein KP79_PYT01405 [Mizuhopecten yessoensis]
MIAGILSVFVGVCLLVYGTSGFECCIAHYGDPLVQDNDAMWCADYCCHVPTMYYCCDDILLQADSSDREGTCADYFHQHIWVPILIAIACAAAIIACCCCCYCCCCRQGQRGGGTVFIPNTGSAPNVTVVNSSTNSMQSSTNSMPSMYVPPPTDPYRAGYEQGKQY